MSTAATATTNSGAGDHHLILPKNYNSLPKTLIKDLSLHVSSLLNPIPETLYNHHSHRVGPGQDTSAVVHVIPSPAHFIWSILRRFENPLTYKRFLKSCHVGALREVHVVSGLPASSSTERLDVLDDERYVVGFSVVSGEHRLKDYWSVTTLQEVAEEGVTVVVESYVVDVPVGNTREETCVFVDTIVRCNLHALAEVAKNMTIPT